MMRKPSEKARKRSILPWKRNLTSKYIISQAIQLYHLLHALPILFHRYKSQTRSLPHPFQIVLNYMPPRHFRHVRTEYEVVDLKSFPKWTVFMEVSSRR